MILINNLSNFIILQTEPIKVALEKINQNQAGFLIVTFKDGTLFGAVTDGDIRRFLLKDMALNLTTPIANATNRNVSFFIEDQKREKIKEILKKHKFCPVLDKNKVLKGIYVYASKSVYIENRLVSEDSPSLIIAEIGNNHNGSFDLAKELVDKAVASGADCVKFQMRDMLSLYKFRNDNSEDLGLQYTFDLLDRFQLNTEELLKIFDYCKSVGTIPLCTPWDMVSLEILESYGMSAYKVASADMTNHIFLEELAKTNKPLIISTGMSSEQNIKDTIKLLESLSTTYILLHCNSTYPAPYSDINLSYIKKLQELSSCIVGYSGHELGISVSIAAIALGAKVLERHFTLDKSMEGNDHKISLLPHEFKNLVKGVRETEEAMCFQNERFLSQGELMNRENLGKSLYFVRKVLSGQVFKREDFNFTSPGSGLQPIELPNIIGKIAKKNFEIGQFIYLQDISDINYVKKKWHFKMRYGIPVRYHDFEELYENCNFDIVEFHLSYQDLEIDPSQYISKDQPYDLIVHCPELFKGDHILNLVSEDSLYLKESISNLEKTIERTLHLKSFFPKTSKPLLITNIGGFSKNDFENEKLTMLKYEKLGKILEKYKRSGVEIIPQTMPPFPWHFGGQSYHNMFVKLDEIISFCNTYQVRICLDISHTKLACQFFKESFFNAINNLAPYTAHIHVADARGTKGEGIQINSGEIGFKTIWPLIEKLYQNASFVPEVWQGHKNKGSGFWEALEKLANFK